MNLVDSHYVADPAKFIAVMLMSLTQMIQLELPAINVLSKIDLIEQYGALRTSRPCPVSPFIYVKSELVTNSDLSSCSLRTRAALNLNLEYFTEGGQLEWLVQALEADPLMRRHGNLNRALAEVIEDFSLVAFHTLDIQNKESVLRLSQAIDKSNGYMYSGLDANKVTYDAIIGKPERDPRWALEVQERYVRQ